MGVLCCEGTATSEVTRVVAITHKVVLSVPAEFSAVCGGKGKASTRPGPHLLVKREPSLSPALPFRSLRSLCCQVDRQESLDRPGVQNSCVFFSDVFCGLPGLF